MSIVNARSRVCGSGSENPKNEFVYFSRDTNPVSGVATEASCAAHVIKSSVYTITDVDQAITLRNPRFMGLLKCFGQQNGFQPPDTIPARINVNPPQTACAAALSSNSLNRPLPTYRPAARAALANPSVPPFTTRSGPNDAPASEGVQVAPAKGPDVIVGL